MNELIGKSIDRYQVIELLGEGGMASVYKALDTRLERYVAIKVIRSAAQAPEFTARFEREARALAQLTHPNIVRVLDSGEFEGKPYIVMEYLPGGTLRNRMGRPLTVREAVKLILPVAEALRHAHERKIIHRDVKPANILLTQSGAPMLSDFGVAKVLESSQAAELTKTGSGVGTPEYMAPEQGLGKPVNARMDIYALGVVLYELITGIKPFAADTPMAVMMKHITEPLPDPRLFVPGLPETVVQVLGKALAKNPDDRYADMTDFYKALENLPSTRSEVSRPEQVTDVVTRLHLKPVQSNFPQSINTQQPDQYLSTPLPPGGQKTKKGFPAWAIALIGLGGLGVLGILAVILAGVLLLGGNDPTATVQAVSQATSTQAVVVAFTEAVSSTAAATQEPTTFPSVTPAPPPTETPAIVPIPDVQVFEDDFSDSGSGWEISNSDDGSVGYLEGVYFVRTVTENIVMWGSARQDFVDAIIEVDTTQVTAPTNNNNDYGVMCRLQANGDGYSFSISGDGFFTIQKSLEDSFTNLVEWKASSLINKGNASNHLMAVCEGDTLSFYVNGSLMTEVHDTEFTSGDIALTATSYEPEITEIHYDNLIVKFH